VHWKSKFWNQIWNQKIRHHNIFEYKSIFIWRSPGVGLTLMQPLLLVVNFFYTFWTHTKFMFIYFSGYINLSSAQCLSESPIGSQSGSMYCAEYNFIQQCCNLKKKNFDKAYHYDWRLSMFRRVKNIRFQW